MSNVIQLLDEARYRAATAWAVKKTNDSDNTDEFVSMWCNASLLIKEDGMEVNSLCGEKVTIPHLNFLYS
jgi:hypothetical protein